jgi:6-phosphofructokinase 1
VGRGTNFSIVAVAEGARSVEDARALAVATVREERARGQAAREAARAEVELLETQHIGNTLRLAHQLEELTGLESRVSILGYIQRGGTPSPVDRLLATRLGSAAADLVAAGTYGVMVAARGEGTEPVPLEQVAGRRKMVPLDHPWIAAARQVGTCLGD